MMQNAEPTTTISSVVCKMTGLTGKGWRLTGKRLEIYGEITGEMTG
jgi:hypothetical protein